MTSAPTAPGFQPSDDAWRQVEALVQEVAQLSTSQISVADFYRSLLEKAVQAMAATGGVVWLPEAGGRWTVECQLGLDGTPPGDALVQPEHLRLVAQTALSGAPQLVQPDAAGPLRNPLSLLLVMAPVIVDGAALAVLEILQRPGTATGAQRGFLRFIATLSELAADFHSHQRSTVLRQHNARLEQMDEFAQLVHGSLDPVLIGYVIANEGRRLIGCDRLSVLVRRSRHCELLAISGVDQFDARSALSRQMTQLGEAVLRIHEPLWYGEGTQNLPPQLEEQIHAYLDLAHSRMVALVPLREQAWMGDVSETPRDVEATPALGVLVIERFESGAIEPAMQDAAAAVCRHSVPALRNAQEIESLPLASWLRRLSKFGWIAGVRQWPKWVAALAAVAGLLAIMAIIPADFALESPGELQPERRREVFASSDGVVQQLNVAHGDQVTADQVLITLQKPQLDFELSRVLGETQTARKRLAGIQAERLGPDGGRAASPEKANQLTAEEEEVKQLLTSLDAQYAVLRAQQADLSLRSPIAGQVLTWNVADLLAARPVQRGQALLTVADLTGPWNVELRLPDDRAGYLLEAEKQATRPLEVTFVLASEPGVTQRGRVERVALAAESQTPEAPSHVLVTVSIDSDKITSPRPGATLTAKIHCGRRSLAFVWLHDVWNAIYSRLLF